MSHQMSHPAQLDLFNDSGAVVFANDALDALHKRDASRAAVCIQRITDEEPEYHSLNALRTLCRTVRDWPLPSSNPLEIAEAVQRIVVQVQPAVEALMRGEAGSFMRPFWLDLAKAPGSQAFDAGFPQSFSACLYLRSGDNLAAIKAVESVPNWQNNPDLLCWLCLARYRANGLDGCRSLLIKLAFLWPKHFPTIINEIADPQIRREWIAFKSEFDWFDPDDELAGAWFPVWQLLEYSDTQVASDALPELTTPAVEAFDLLGRLIKLEKRGLSPALVSLRSQLRDLDQNLFIVYMARRSVARL
jgi:hypothetical protein